MDMITVTAKTVDEAVTKALIELETTSDKLEYEVVEKEAPDFWGSARNRRSSVLRKRDARGSCDRLFKPGI